VAVHSLRNESNFRGGPIEGNREDREQPIYRLKVPINGKVWRKLSVVADTLREILVEFAIRQNENASR
jgi:hypothetical protein